MKDDMAVQEAIDFLVENAVENNKSLKYNREAYV